MSNAGIKLSPKHGLNPTIPVCFWCGEERNEVALLGHIGDGRKHEDFEAPMHMVIDYEPCEKCRANMALGVTLMEATNKPNSVTKVEMQKGVYPTGRYVVIIMPSMSSALFLPVKRAVSFISCMSLLTESLRSLGKHGRRKSLRISSKFQRE